MSAVSVVLVMRVGRLLFSTFLARLLPTIAASHVLHPFSIAFYSG
jgi:hypothetical protein